MQNTVLAHATPFDVAAAVARRAQLRPVPARLAMPRPYPVAPALAPVVDPWDEAASLGWTVTMNVSAARRWLSCDPPRFEEVEASLRCIGEACAGSHPDEARELIDKAAELARAGNVLALLDSLTGLTAPGRP